MFLLRRPLLWAPFMIGASSISTLILYFYGIATMRTAVLSLLIPASAALSGLLIWARQGNRIFWNRIVAGLFAGSLATLTYDLVRVPVVWAGVPVFKAISYFGTVILGQSNPTFISDVTGWTYHFSNGVGFGLMYAVMVERPRWWSALLWGIALEVAMLATPYVEVFGYKVSSQFLGITIGAHAVYGLTLWGGLRVWSKGESLDSGLALRPMVLAAIWFVAPVGVGIAAADFSARYRDTIPPSPPEYVGSHLYVTWDVPEPDRVAALWAMRTFVEPEARFHFIPAFTSVAYGKPFDMPEAEVRRQGVKATVEVLVDNLGRTRDEKLELLAAMAHLTEITPWMLPSRPEAATLAATLETVLKTHCGEHLNDRCVEHAFDFLKKWYYGVHNA